MDTDHDTVVTDRSGHALGMRKLDGRLYPRFPVESLKQIRHFRARPDDVLLCTYPKSGTHWTYTVIRYLLEGETNLPMVEKRSSMIEFNSPAYLKDLASPRNLNTHFAFEALSPDFFHKETKIIYMTRDPRDAAVSVLNHNRNYLFNGEGYSGSWADFFQLFIDGQVDYGSWLEYTKEFEKGIREHPDHPFLVMSYEAMKRDPLRETRRINDFLGTGRTEDFLKEVVEKTSFASMKNQRIASNMESLVLYRKGEVGDWRNWFTVAQSEQFNEVFEKEMMGTEAHRLYSHSSTKQTDIPQNNYDEAETI